MPTNRVTTGSSLVETVRTLTQGEASSTATAASARKVISDQGKTTSRHAVAKVQDRLRSLLAGVEPDDEHAMRASRELVLREIILWEFGSDFRRSAHFQSMVEHINQGLDNDERFRLQYAEMVRGLMR